MKLPPAFLHVVDASQRYVPCPVIVTHDLVPHLVCSVCQRDQFCWAYGAYQTTGPVHLYWERYRRKPQWMCQRCYTRVTKRRAALRDLSAESQRLGLE